jgi:hypothetical protein
VFRAYRSGDAVSCVLSAYGNVIAMSINPNQKGLPEIGAKIEGNTKLLCKDAGSLVMRATGVQTTKIKMPIGELHPRLMNLGENGKYMGGEGGLYVASPETHEGCAGHMIGIDADKGLIYDCAEEYALTLAVGNIRERVFPGGGLGGRGDWVDFPSLGSPSELLRLPILLCSCSDRLGEVIY